MYTNLSSQAVEMDSHGITNDLLPILNCMTVVIFLPILKHILNPALRWVKLAFLPVNRMPVGFIIGGVAMAYVVGL